MSNRIEEAIRKIIFERKQQDALLEQIIKKSLITEASPRKITIKPLSNKELEYAQSQGAEFGYAIITKDIVRIESDMNSWVRDVTVKSDEDTRNRVAIGPSGKFAKGTTAYNLNLNDPKSTVNLPNYIYIVRGPYEESIDGPTQSKRYVRKRNKAKEADDTKIKGRFKMVVWIIPLSVYGPLLQYKGVYQGVYSDNVFDILDLNKSKIGNTVILDDNDFKVLLTNRLTKIKPGTADELKTAPESWGKNINKPQSNFEGERPKNWIEYVNRGLGLGQSTPVDVADQEVWNGKFTGKWDNNFEVPISGKWIGDKATMEGEFLSSPAENKWWLSQGTITYADGDKLTGQFNQSFQLNGSNCTYVQPDGTTTTGTFKDGLFIEGKMVHPDGKTRTGSFNENGKLISGKIVYPDGDEESGIFISGVTIYIGKNVSGGGQEVIQFHYDDQGNIDTTKIGYKEFYDSSNKLINYYSGTINTNGTALTGTLYKADKTIVIGTYTNGVWKPEKAK